MIKVIISGYGKMGHMIEDELKRRNIELIEASEDITSTDPTIAKDCVCIDFTTPQAFRTNYPFIARHFKAAVVGTTGWNDIFTEVKKTFEDCGTTLIYSSNFSLGVNALFAAITAASKMLREAGYTPRIEEIHHIHKLDAPSGTAKTIGELVKQNLGVEPQISSFREGEVPGTHSLTLTSECDRLTLRHEAFSRQGFARGAVAAALLTENIAGVHDFSEIIITH